MPQLHPEVEAHIRAAARELRRRRYARRYVRRLTDEWRDHACMISENDPASIRRQIGDLESLVASVCQQKHLRPMPVPWAALFYGVGPVVLLVLLSIVALSVGGIAVEFVRSCTRHPENDSVYHAFVYGLVYACWFGIPIITTAIFVYITIRRGTSMLWLLLAVFVVSYFYLPISLHIQDPSPGGRPGTVSFGSMFSAKAYLLNWPRLVWVSLPLLCVLLPFRRLNAVFSVNHTTE